MTFARRPIRRAALVYLERVSSGNLRRQLRRLRLESGTAATFAAYLRRVAVRGRGPRLVVACGSTLCGGQHHRPIIEAALRRFELKNPHLFPSRRQMKSVREGAA
jgi:hypothetical protein